MPSQPSGNLIESSIRPAISQAKFSQARASGWPGYLTDELLPALSHHMGGGRQKACMPGNSCRKQISSDSLTRLQLNNPMGKKIESFNWLLTSSHPEAASVAN
jgi:hypothetical protein